MCTACKCSGRASNRANAQVNRQRGFDAPTGLLPTPPCVGWPARLCSIAWEHKVHPNAQAPPQRAGRSESHTILSRGPALSQGPLPSSVGGKEPYVATHTRPNAYHLHRGQFAKLQRRMCSSCPSVTQPTLSAIVRSLCGRFFLLREIRPVLTDDAEGRLAASTSFSNSLRLCRALPSAKANKSEWPCFVNMKRTLAAICSFQPGKDAHAAPSSS